MIPAAPFTRPLAAVGKGDVAEVGGKAAGLGDLIAGGLAVPPGFAVTTAAFGQAMRALDPGGTIPAQVGSLAGNDQAAIAAVSAAVREAILAAPLPTGVRAALGGCYRSLTEDSGTGVAVRSSATSEDSATASFAGLGDSYLWLRGEDAVADAVRRCWASLYSAESVIYRRQRGVPEQGLAMGVVVQVMVDARRAGVMFTRSPVTGDTSVIVIEAAWGLGSALVSGDVTPDTYVVSKVTGEIVKRAVATKSRRHERDPGRPGVRVLDVPAGLRDVPCLADEEVRGLAGLGRRVSERCGTHQDIEWAITEGGQIVLLQSRPETVWAHRRAAPAAEPRARAFDHVLDGLGLPGRRAAP